MLDGACFLPALTNETAWHDPEAHLGEISGILFFLLGTMVIVELIVVAANAGGGWSPLGDVTTTMLWVGGQVSAMNIVKMLLLPSLICLIVPLALLSMRLKDNVGTPEALKRTSPEAKTFEKNAFSGQSNRPNYPTGKNKKRNCLNIKQLRLKNVGSQGLEP